jgi:hypothetical protein
MRTAKHANDNEPRGIEVSVVRVEGAPGQWLVEAIDYGSEGDVFRATFAGAEALERALDYARLTYAWPAAACW